MKNQAAAACSSGQVARGFLSAPSRHPVRCDDGMTSSLSRVEGAVQKLSVAVLYVRKNSVYKKIPVCDVFDLARDARSFSGDLPVIAHPPCRLWGRLRGFSTAPAEEKLLALHAVDVLRKCGGVFEHPAGSLLWSAAGLPLRGERDAFGGFTMPILQSWFGHKAPKNTWLYIVGIAPSELPVFPIRLGISAGRICGSGSMKLREGTPPELANWLVNVAARCKRPVACFVPASGIKAGLLASQIASCEASTRQKSLFDLPPAVFVQMVLFQSCSASTTATNSHN